MRPTLLRHVALAGVLFGCSSTQTLRAEYALDPAEHPEGIECFYGCLRHTDENARRSCLWFCDGVEVTETYDACAPGSPSLCRSYPAREPMPAVDDSIDDDGDVAADIIGTILVGLVHSAIGADDDGEDEDEQEERRQPRSYREERVRKPAAPSRGPKPWRERRERRK